MGGGPANYPRGKRTGCTACSESAPAFYAVRSAALEPLSQTESCPEGTSENVGVFG